MFFTAIHQMMTEGVDLTLVIRKANGQLTVSLLPKSNGLKDEAQNHLVPLTVSGHPQELDAGFLQAVARPIQKTTGLISNMAQFEAQAEKAASESKAAKETKAKETKEEKEKREKYEKHFKKAEELIAAKNHKEAVTALGQARLYAKPQDQKKIDEMVAYMEKYPASKVAITGYADKETGNPRINMTLSEKRANNVAEVLKAKGITADRIKVDYKGDTVQPYNTPKENRVSICIVE